MKKIECIYAISSTNDNLIKYLRISSIKLHGEYFYEAAQSIISLLLCDLILNGSLSFDGFFHIKISNKLTGFEFLFVIYI